MNNTAVNAMLKTATKKVKFSYQYTFQELQWGDRMLHYIAGDLEKDYNVIAAAHSYLPTRKSMPDLFDSFFRWVQALSQQYALKEAMGIFSKRYKDVWSTVEGNPLNEATGEMMRLTFHHTFPGKSIDDVLHFSCFCLELAMRNGNCSNTFFHAYSDEEAFDMIVQAYLDQDESLPDHSFWLPVKVWYTKENHVAKLDITKQFFEHAGDLIGPQQYSLVDPAADEQLYGLDSIDDILDEMDTPDLKELAKNLGVLND